MYNIRNVNARVTQELKVMKVKEADGSQTCFVLTLNRSDSALPEAVLNASATVTVLASVFMFFCSPMRNL